MSSDSLTVLRAGPLIPPGPSLTPPLQCITMPLKHARSAQPPSPQQSAPLFTSAAQRMASRQQTLASSHSVQAAPWPYFSMG
eukprot:6381878-Ditylum_brightwellii.AAC.1